MTIQLIEQDFVIEKRSPIIILNLTFLVSEYIVCAMKSINQYFFLYIIEYEWMHFSMVNYKLQLIWRIFTF